MALAGSALAAAPAHAAWSPAALLDTGGRAAGAPLISPARGGGATVLFKAGGAAARATVDAAGSTTAFDPLAGPFTAAVADARGRAILGRVVTKRDWPLRLRIVQPDGSFSRSRTYAYHGLIFSLAANRAGQAVIAATAGGRVVAATGSTRFGFGAPQSFGGAGVTAVDTAINAAGDAIVAFRRRGRLFTSEILAGGERFSDAQDLGPSARSENPELDVAVGAAGAALVAYTDGRRFLATTREPAGDWAEPQVLEDELTGGGLRPDGEVVGSTASLVYLAEDGVARFAQGAVGTRLAQPVALSAPGARVIDVALAANAKGDLAVVFDEDYVARAAVKPAGGAMGAAQTIDTAGVDAIDVAVAPGGAGRFLAAIETGERPKSTRRIRISAFAP